MLGITPLLGLLVLALAPPPDIALRWDADRREYHLRAADVPLADVGAALARAAGCTVEVDARLRTRRLTLDRSAPRPGRFFPVVARRADARLSVRYRLLPLRPGEPPGGGGLAFDDRPVSLRLRQPANVTEIGRRLHISVEAAEGVGDAVRVDVVRVPLDALLARIAVEANARWETVVRLEPLSVVDAEAVADERMHAHFQDLARLSVLERRQQLASDLRDLEGLPLEQRTEGVRRMAQDVRSLGTLFAGVPGEHRARVAPTLRAIGGDYAFVLGRSRDRRALFAPVLDALTDLEQRLAEIR